MWESKNKIIDTLFRIESIENKMSFKTPIVGKCFTSWETAGTSIQESHDLIMAEINMLREKQKLLIDYLGLEYKEQSEEKYPKFVAKEYTK